MGQLTVDMEEYSTGRRTVWVLRQSMQGWTWFWFDRGHWLELGCLGTFDRQIDGRRYLINICKAYFCITPRKNPPSACSQNINITMEPELAWRIKATAHMLNLSLSELIKQVYISWSDPGEFKTLDRERILEAFEERRERLRLI